MSYNNNYDSFFSYLSYLAQSSKFDVETSSITVIIW